VGRDSGKRRVREEEPSGIIAPASNPAQSISIAKRATIGSLYATVKLTRVARVSGRSA